MIASPKMQPPPPDTMTDGGHACQAASRRLDQLEFALPEESPFDSLASGLLSRTAGMFDLHLGMTLSDYQNRWLEIVDVAHEVMAAAKAESTRLHRLAQEQEPHRRRWRAEAAKMDGFIAGAFNAAEQWFLDATEPLLAAYEARFPDDEWFGLVLADYRACEAYGGLTLQQIIDLEESGSE